MSVEIAFKNISIDSEMQKIFWWGKMLVRFTGFNIEGSTNFPVNEFLEILSSEKRSDVEFEDVGRFIFIDSDKNDDYHLGLIVTVKNQRKFCELRASGKSFKFVVNNLDTNSRLMEFNFFVVNKKSGLGLYQHYHQSCSINQGLFLLARKYSSLKQIKHDDYVKNQIESGKPQKKAQSAAKRYLKGSMKWAIIVRKDDLGVILEKWKEIKAFEINLIHLDPEQSEFGLLTDFVKRKRTKLSFKNTSSISNISSGIVAYLKEKTVSSGRVFGVDHEGMDRIIKLQNNPTFFLELDFDEVASHLNNLDVEMFTESWVITKLLDVCKNQDHFFEANVR